MGLQHPQIVPVLFLSILKSISKRSKRFYNFLLFSALPFLLFLWSIVLFHLSEFTACFSINPDTLKLFFTASKNFSFGFLFYFFLVGSFPLSFIQGRFFFLKSFQTISLLPPLPKHTCAVSCNLYIYFCFTHP